jgi:hypothetical protein
VLPDRLAQEIASELRDVFLYLGVSPAFGVIAPSSVESGNQLVAILLLGDRGNPSEFKATRYQAEGGLRPQVGENRQHSPVVLGRLR